LFYVVAFKFDEFYEKVNKLLFSRAIGEHCFEELNKTELKELGDVDLAVKTYFLLRTSFSGKISKSYSFRLSFGNAKNIAKIYFNSLLELELIHNRLKNVIIECMDFRSLLSKIIDRENVFIYLDPPYYGTEYYYKTSFSEKDHKDLLEILKTAKAKWLLSGYANPLYDKELKDFYRIEVPVVKYSYGIIQDNKKQAKPRAIEVLWANYDITKQEAKLWKNL
jgi:DNA adenine methylase